MKKCFLLLMLVLLSSPAFPEPPDPCHIQVLIRDQNDTEVVVPCMAKNDLIQVTSSFLSKGDDQVRIKLNTLMREKGGNLTLTITSIGRKK